MTREDFHREAQSRLDQLFNQMEALESKAEKSEGEAKAELDDKLAGLNRKKAELKTKLEQSQAVADDQWEEVKAGFEDSLSSLEEAYAKLKGVFS